MSFAYSRFENDLTAEISSIFKNRQSGRLVPSTPNVKSSKYEDIFTVFWRYRKVIFNIKEE